MQMRNLHYCNAILVHVAMQYTCAVVRIHSYKDRGSYEVFVEIQNSTDPSVRQIQLTR